MAESITPSQNIERLVDSTLTSFDQFRIKRRNIRIPNEPPIAGGGFGCVHRANLGSWIVGGPTVAVAVKKLYPRDKSFLGVAAALAREVAVWAPLYHPNLLPLVGFHLDVKKEEAWLVSSYAEYGTILNYIRMRDPDSRERAEMATDTIQGLHYLHTRQPPICHGDIKSVNVLMNSQGRAMLCDFGLAQAQGDPSGLTTPDFRHAATPRYQSPEILAGRERSLKGDIWAWGCLVLELLSGLTPYQYATNDLQAMKLIHEEKPPADLDDVELLPSIRGLLGGCWAIEPELRPTSEHCLYVLTAQEREAFRQKSLWASAAVVGMLRRDLDDVLRRLDNIRLRRSLIKISPKDTIDWGAVYPAKMRKGIASLGVDVAVKVLRITGVEAACVRMLIAVIRELRVWSTLNHPNILPLIGFYLSDTLEEVCTEKRLNLIQEVAAGLIYLHRLNPPICHGDIKPSNILINKNGIAVLCDFGLSRSIEGMQTGLTTSTFDQCKSVAYQSPELFLGKSRRTPASDVWAWGCTAHEIFSGRSPYLDITNPAQIIDRIQAAVLPNDVRHASVPSYLRPVLMGCWQANPELRCSAASCIPALDCLKGLNIDRSLIISLETGADADWSTGHAVLNRTYPSAPSRQSHNVIVRRAKIHNNGQQTLLDVLHRLYMWTALSHPYIEQLFGICLEEFPTHLWLVLRRLPSVYPITTAARLHVRDRYELVCELTRGLHYLHTQTPPFYHGCLNPGRVLIGASGRAVVCDPGFFGLPTGKDAGPYEGVAYLSPETVNDGSMTLSSDVWGWGCIAQEVLSGQPPYDGAVSWDAIKDTMQQGVLPARIDDLEISAETKNVIQASWGWEPASRPSMELCLKTLAG